MKRKLLLALVMVLALGVAGVANAAVVEFTDVLPLNLSLYGRGLAQWEHSVPLDFTVPPDTLNSATLTITGLAWWGTGFNDYVRVEQSIVLGNLQSSDLEIFKVLNVDQYFIAGWDYGVNGTTMDVYLSYNQWLFPLCITDSSLTVNYNENGTSPVPEPGTMLLLGSGLVGLAGWGRKKFRK